MSASTLGTVTPRTVTPPHSLGTVTPPPPLGTVTPPGASGTFAPPGSAGIDDLLAAARSRLHRLDPHDAHRAADRGAVLIDIRPAAQRAAHGAIPDALVIERNVLEWRLDPRSDARLGFATRYDLQVIVFCQEGYTSSLAAASLHDLGLTRATDVVGGFAAWAAAGLPTG
ncbi:rhodanese-like domain-containing protein [Jidongwangia harbinensis]|uniref:rhodanese-like domain-containing protein n=1 Tax=Jidongwangia harbinensis TaxID=2878561 RepID=UPI0027DF2EE0|nr:rhodanese-like domain-containing protein [Jidongwangia harbinensis]